MEKFINFVKKNSKRLDSIAGMVVLGIALLVILNIILRGLFGSAIYGVYEYVCYLTLLVVSLALAHCAFQGGHINITLLLEKFTTKLRKVINIVFDIFILTTFVLVVWNLADYAREMYILGYVSSNTRIPLHYIVAIIVAGFALLTISVFIRLIEDIKDAS